jgi:L-2-hydroxyglutarate oxidase LhgO
MAARGPDGFNAMSDVVDAVVIGAGVVGLAIARELAVRGREVIVLEKNGAIGEETSARNSEVIHAGIYYPAGSLKARLCVEGRERLYAYCPEKGIPHRRCGKLIVAVHDAQRSKLDALGRFAAANGVADLEALDVREIAALEPAVRGVAGLWSPSTGIVDSHALMLAYRGDLERAGGSIALRARCAAAARDGELQSLSCDVDGDTTELAARVVVNAAGLHALDVARLLAQPGLALPRARFAKGSYFVCRGKGPFTHLVYPVPEDGGLGIHATLDLAGRTRFGPNVEWLPTGTRPEDLDYAVDPRLAAAFYAAIKTYWPAIPDGSLEPAYSGVRPKISGPGEPAADFAIHAHAAPGAPRIVQLFGIESPGLTASLAIATHVAALLERASA